MTESPRLPTHHGDNHDIWSSRLKYHIIIRSGLEQRVEILSRVAVTRPVKCEQQKPPTTENQSLCRISPILRITESAFRAWSVMDNQRLVIPRRYCHNSGHFICKSILQITSRECSSSWFIMNALHIRRKLIYVCYTELASSRGHNNQNVGSIWKLSCLSLDVD